MGQIGTLVHAADLHLGSPLQSLGGSVGEEKAQQIRLQSIKAFDRLIDMTIEHEADVLVLAGDVYDSAEKEPRAQLQFASAMRRLMDAGVSVFIAHGNHDPVVTGFKPAASLPDNVVVFEPDTPQVHQVVLRSGSELEVVGVSFGKEHETENLAKRFLRLPTDPRRTVGVLHTNVGSNSLHGDYAPCTPEDLEAAPVGYWALGHIHARSVTAMGQGRWWAYPGNLQGRSTKATECGPKGALIVPILDQGFGQPDFSSCDAVRFAREDVDVSEAVNLGDVVRIVDERLVALEDTADGRPVVARVRLRGATEAHHQLIHESDGITDTIRSDIRSGAILSKIEISTRHHVDRQQLIDRENLLSDILRYLDGNPLSDESLAEMVGSSVDKRALKELEELIGRDVIRISDLQSQIETALTDLLVEDS